MNSRQERKRTANQKRTKIILEIGNIIKTAIVGGKSFEQALTLGDEYLNREIRMHPQDKDLIMTAGYLARDLLARSIQEAVKEV